MKDAELIGPYIILNCCKAVDGQGCINLIRGIQQMNTTLQDTFYERKEQKKAQYISPWIEELQDFKKLSIQSINQQPQHPSSKRAKPVSKPIEVHKTHEKKDQPENRKKAKSLSLKLIEKPTETPPPLSKNTESHKVINVKFPTIKRRSKSIDALHRNLLGTIDSRGILLNSHVRQLLKFARGQSDQTKLDKHQLVKKDISHAKASIIKLSLPRLPPL